MSSRQSDDPSKILTLLQCLILSLFSEYYDFAATMSIFAYDVIAMNNHDTLQKSGPNPRDQICYMYIYQTSRFRKYISDQRIYISRTRIYARSFKSILSDYIPVCFNASFAIIIMLILNAE